MLTSAGCATERGEKYTFRTLPKKYLAGIRENPQTIELTRLASATANSDVLDRGDVLELTIAAGLNEKDTIRMPIRIQDDGNVDIPEIGRVQLAGLEMTAAEAAIVYECMSKGLYRNPNVTLLMKKQRTNRVMVMGAVNKPKAYELPRGQCDLLSALSEAEGLHESAGTKVIIRNMGSQNGRGADPIAGRSRGGIDPAGHSVEMASSREDSITVDLISATKNGTGGFQLKDGAVVYVEKRDPEPLYVMGLVSRPGRIEFPVSEEVRVTDAISLAGGVSSMAADKVFVIRRKPVDPDAPSASSENAGPPKTFIIQVSLANAKQIVESNISLVPGDVVSVEQTPVTFVLEIFKRFSMNLGGSIPLIGTPIF